MTSQYLENQLEAGVSSSIWSHHCPRVSFIKLSGKVEIAMNQGKFIIKPSMRSFIFVKFIGSRDISDGSELDP